MAGNVNLGSGSWIYLEANTRSVGRRRTSDSTMACLLLALGPSTPSRRGYIYSKIRGILVLCLPLLGGEKFVVKLSWLFSWNYVKFSSGWTQEINLFIEVSLLQSVTVT